MSIAAVSILSLFATSASMERSFSTPRVVCTDRQMGIQSETVAAKFMIQVK
jgi:hypothetical protein